MIGNGIERHFMSNSSGAPGIRNAAKQGSETMGFLFLFGPGYGNRRGMIRRRFLSNALTATAATTLLRTASAQHPDGEDFKLFLLVGQSNMAGRGKVGPKDLVPNPRVWSFNKSEKWVPAIAPLHFDKPGIVGVGLGRAFGIAAAEQHPEWNIGLVPCAVGGSPLSSWEPGARYDALGVTPYDDAIRRAKAAMKNGTLSGILWHQGESDAGKPEQAATYAERLTKMIGQFRSDLDAPDVPFLIGELGHLPDRPYTDRNNPVCVAHREVAESVPNCAVVSSKGLTPKSDGTHFDAESAKEFGKRYANIWEKKFGD